jgi:hypothetical protein
MNTFLAIVKSAAIYCLLLCLSGEVIAVNYCMRPVPETTPQFGIRFMRADYKWDNSPLSNTSGLYDLYGNVPLRPDLSLIFDLPVARSSFTFPMTDINGYPIGDTTITEHSFGNVMIGIQKKRQMQENIATVATACIHFPTAEADKYDPFIVAVSSDPYQLEKVMPRTWILNLNLSLRGEAVDFDQAGGYFGLDMGPLLFIPGGDAPSSQETELIIRYGLSAGAIIYQFSMGFELLGMMLATEDFDSFGDRFDHFAVVGASLVGTMIRPGIFYQFPLVEEYSNVLCGALGLKLDFVLPD